MTRTNVMLLVICSLCLAASDASGAGSEVCGNQWLPRVTEICAAVEGGTLPAKTSASGQFALRTGSLGLEITKQGVTFEGPRVPYSDEASVAWDDSDDYSLYAVQSRALYKYRILTGTSELVADLGTDNLQTPTLGNNSRSEKGWLPVWDASSSFACLVSVRDSRRICGNTRQTADDPFMPTAIALSAAGDRGLMLAAVGSGTARVFAVDETPGTLVWAYDVASPLAGPVALVEESTGEMFAIGRSGGDGRVAALQVRSGGEAQVASDQAPEVRSAAPVSCNVASYGANAGGQNPGATTSAFARAFRECANGEVYAGPGTYAIENNNGPFKVHDFNGTFRSNGAKLLFTNNTKGGITFVRGVRARILQIRYGYQYPPTVRRSPEEGLKFEDTVDTILDGVTVENSPAAGVLFYNSIRPVVQNVNVISSLADGVHFANCQDVRVSNVTTTNTGDDGLAFLNYSQYPDKRGGVANNISVRGSRARGIAVVGQSNVTITNFTIDGTSASGVYVAKEGAPYFTRLPENVKISGGTINNAGTVSPQVGNPFGIHYADPGSVVFEHIRITNAFRRGFDGYAPAGRVTAHDIYVQNNREWEGMHLSAGQLSLQDVTAEGSPSNGIVLLNSGSVYARNLNVVNCSLRNNLGRALWIEGNGMQLDIEGVNIIDNQNPGRGYVVGEYSPARNNGGSLRGVQGSVDNGRVRFEKASGGLSFAPPAGYAGVVRYDLRPGSPALPAATTAAALTVRTNRPAVCRVSDVPGVSFASLTQTMAGSGGTTHSMTKSGVQKGRAYKAYVRCQDVVTKITNVSDAMINFSVAP